MSLSNHLQTILNSYKQHKYKLIHKKDKTKLPHTEEDQIDEALKFLLYKWLRDNSHNLYHTFNDVFAVNKIDNLKGVKFKDLYEFSFDDKYIPIKYMNKKIREHLDKQIESYRKDLRDFKSSGNKYKYFQVLLSFLGLATIMDDQEKIDKANDMIQKWMDKEI